ncbi:hypothetical protein H4R33_004447 [Dimargaris cristalligena]|uniref:Aldehyde reductase n=1 Tax=Dimargaris cristalligena TaxID=215637 RepID=A0A4P9ZLH5_9FUNG|nr:hypothetical protein H4R33_004447 [Dimargaris cristalligena]RKP33975.1 aldehyde reductase [Dimargaris cristalligena]|eukprot:RKP33975.1 aldehyde reductase [Dimargaris cristalligena]
MSTHSTFTLNSGAKIPALGFGTWRSEPEKVKNAVKEALRIGYRHIDCASVYENQEEVGKALRESDVPRDQIWITSKLWNTEHNPKDVGPACDDTLRKLGIDYLDLYLMHWPVAFKKDGDKFDTSVKHANGKPVLNDVSYVDTWKAMEKLVRDGKTRNIGVSNFNIAQLTTLLAAAEIPPAVNQVEVHPYNQNQKLIDFCKSKGIEVTAYCPIGSTGKPSVMEDPAVKEVAEETGHTPAQVILAWGLQHGTSVIPKSVTPSRIESNFKSDFKLTDAQYQKITNIGTKVRVCEPHDMWGLPEGTLFDE